MAKEERNEQIGKRGWRAQACRRAYLEQQEIHNGHDVIGGQVGLEGQALQQRDVLLPGSLVHDFALLPLRATAACHHTAVVERQRSCGVIPTGARVRSPMVQTRDVHRTGSHLPGPGWTRWVYLWRGLPPAAPATTVRISLAK